MTSQKIRQYLTLTCKTPIPKLLILIKLSIKISKIWQSYSHVLLILSISVPNLVTIGRHVTSFLDVKHVKGLYPYFGIVPDGGVDFGRDGSARYVGAYPRRDLKSAEVGVFHGRDICARNTVIPRTDINC